MAIFLFFLLIFLVLFSEKRKSTPCKTACPHVQAECRDMRIEGNHLNKNLVFSTFVMVEELKNTKTLKTSLSQFYLMIKS